MKRSRERYKGKRNSTFKRQVWRLWKGNRTTKNNQSTKKRKIKELEIKSNILTEEFDKLKLENEDLKRQVEEKKRE